MRNKNPSLVCVVFILSAITWLIHGEEDTSVEILEDVIYGHKAGMALIYDVFKPENPNGTALIFMVSYGWASPWEPAKQQQEKFRKYLDQNITIFNVYHGSSPQFKVPDAVADVRRAVRHIRKHAEEYDVDQDKFVTWGFSAGGHLSLMLALDGDLGDSSAQDPIVRVSNQVAAAIAIFPPVDLTDYVGPSDRFPALDFDPELAESVSPIFKVSDDDPPILLIHGDQDQLVEIEHSKRMNTALKKAGVSVHLEIIKGAGHGFYSDEHVSQYQSAIFSFLEKHKLVPLQ